MSLAAVVVVIISRCAAKKISNDKLKLTVEMIGFLLAFVCIIFSDIFDFIKY